jgi:DNA-binding MarR family transcriptional regulator
MDAIRIDRYVVETLMADLVAHDRSPSSFLVYLALVARARGRRPVPARASHRELAEDTGLSKSSVQAAVRNLLRRRLVAVSRASATAVPEYTVLRPWRRSERRHPERSEGSRTR